MMLTAAANTQPDYVALAMVVVMAATVAVMVIRKWIANNRAPEVPAAQPIAPVEKPLAPGSAGEVKFHDVDPKTAAMLMAIVRISWKSP